MVGLVPKRILIRIKIRKDVIFVPLSVLDYGKQNKTQVNKFPNELCVVDRGRAMPRTPMPQLHGGGKAFPR